jgi:peptide/nickel transport system substrate-binding protein
MDNPSNSRSVSLSRRTFLGGVAGTAVGLPLLASACGGGVPSASSTGGGGSGGSGTMQIVLAGGNPQIIMDPVKQSSEVEAIFLGCIYDTLVRIHDDWSLEPMLATSWESDTQLVNWTFHLRPGVEFHDGSPVTAKDVQFSVARNLDVKLGSAIYSRLAPELKADGITVVDSHTIKFSLKQPDAFFPLALGARQCAITPAGTTDFNPGIGSGPFRVKKLNQANQFFVLSRNPSYWKNGVPKLDTLQGTTSNTQSAIVQSVVSGNTHFGGFINPSSAPVIQASSGATTVAHEAYIFNDFVMDPRFPPFNDNRVRDAFKTAIDRDQILQTAYYGHGIIGGDVPVRPTDPFYPAELAVKPRDVEKAKSLLSQAGYPNGFDVTFETAQAGTGMVDVAIAAQQGLTEAGIRMKVALRPADNYYDVVWLHDKTYVDTWLLRHPLDALTVEFTSTAPWNEAKYHNPQFDELLAETKRTADVSEQKKLLGQAQIMVAENAGFCNPAWVDELYAVKKTVAGIEFNVTNEVSFDNATV